MTEKPDKTLEQLILAYRELAACYERVSEFSHEEVLMIDQGDMEALLGLLKEKEAIMTEVAHHHQQVNYLQAHLTDLYKLESFSLKQLKVLVDNDKQKHLTKLQTEINNLIQQLEILEHQENIHEKMLHNYTQRMSRANGSKQQGKAAKRAYSKLANDKINHRDKKE